MRRIHTVTASLFIGLCLTTSFIVHIAADDLPDSALYLAFLLLSLSGLFTALAYLSLRHTVQRLRRFSRRAWGMWVVGVALAGALATVVIPTAPPPVWVWTDVTITPLDARDPAAQGSEVWLLQARMNGRPFPLEAFEHDGAWVWRDHGELVALTGTTAPLRWRGWVRGELTLELLRYPWSGLARVTVNEQVQEVNLYADPADAQTLTLAPRLDAFGWVQRVLFWLADWVSLSALALAVTVAAVAWRPARAASVVALHWYAAPCLVVWSVSLLAFWPGMMSADSLYQWGQMLSGQYSDIHPAAHTLTIWLVTRVWLSPAAYALAQIGALAFTFALAMRELALAGVSRRAQMALTALFALSPVNNVMVITLWKDIPYAIALLGLFWMLLRVWRTGGGWLHSRRAVALAAVLVAAVALFRHNGPPVALLTLLAFPLVGRDVPMRQVALIGGWALILVLVVRGGVYPAFDVAPTPRWFARQTQIHQLGAYAAHSTQLDDADRALLERLLPLDEWRRRYSCYDLSPLLYGAPAINGALFDADVDAYTDLWLRLAVRDPATLIQHQWCVTSLIWRVMQPTDGYLHTWHKILIDDYGKDMGLTPSSVLPGLRDLLASWLTSLERPEVVWLVWRPATYLYLTLFCVAVFCIRHRSWHTAALAMPTIAQLLVLAMLIVSHTFRYQYPVYLIALVAVGLLFVPVPVIHSSSTAECDNRLHVFEPEQKRFETLSI
jgi:hypothetical protein